MFHRASSGSLGLQGAAVSTVPGSRREVRGGRPGGFRLGRLEQRNDRPPLAPLPHHRLEHPRAIAIPDQAADRQRTARSYQSVGLRARNARVRRGARSGAETRLHCSDSGVVLKTASPPQILGHRQSFLIYSVVTQIRWSGLSSRRQVASETTESVRCRLPAGPARPAARKVATCRHFPGRGGKFPGGRDAPFLRHHASLSSHHAPGPRGA